MMDSKAYWVGFNLVKGIGAVRMQALQDYFGDLAIAWQAPFEGLVSAGLSAKIAENVLQTRKTTNLEKYFEGILRKGIQVFIREDLEYPAVLKEIDQPPPVLYVRGSLQRADDWAVAVVGTRRVTAYGRQVAEEVSSYLARNNITVVSGLARGVDGVAHEAALNAGGRSLAVLGSGVDVIYPPEHARLAERIMSNGAILSDYAPGTPPDGVNFPPRNRIISGLSLGTVVIEAGEKSGALITAKFAADQGREVFAIPGSIMAQQSVGTNQLIRDGAHPVLKPEEILEVLELDPQIEKQAIPIRLPDDPVEASLLSLLGREPIYMDDLQIRSGLPIEIVSATMTMLELKGLAKQVGQLQYIAVREDKSEYRVDNQDE